MYENIIKAAKRLQGQRAKSAPWPELQPLTYVDIMDEYGNYTRHGIIAVAYASHRFGVVSM